MSELLAQMRSWPWAWAWLGFFAVAVLRAGATYLIGRGIAAGVVRRRPPQGRTRAVTGRVARWGAPAVTVSFLTVGVQTAVNLAAGLVRMSWPRYLVGLLAGAALWASIWATIGMAAFFAALRGPQEGPLALVVVLVIVVIVSTMGWRSNRRFSTCERR